MTQQETIKLLALIKLAYPNSYKDIDKDTQIATVNMWYKIFESVPYPIMELSIEHFVKTSKFPPTIADINDVLRSMYYEALGNVLSLGSGELRDYNNYIMQYTEPFDKRNDQIISYNKIKGTLNGGTQPLIKG